MLFNLFCQAKGVYKSDLNDCDKLYFRVLDLAQKSYKYITRNIYVPFYPDQTRKINKKSLSGPVAKMGSEQKRNFVKNEKFQNGKRKPEVYKNADFFGCCNNLLCKQFGLIKKLIFFYYLAEQNRLFKMYSRERKKPLIFCDFNWTSSFVILHHLVANVLPSTPPIMDAITRKQFTEFKALIIIISSSSNCPIIQKIHYCKTRTARSVEKPFKVNFMTILYIFLNY